mmetsp:Transcript_31/g.50  ORF Transcript_31/g.50 Transcript_31/m.50 type:complete len:115 (+) Transcript_31:1317-1661(+)
MKPKKQREWEIDMGITLPFIGQVVFKINNPFVQARHHLEAKALIDHREEKMMMLVHHGVAAIWGVKAMEDLHSAKVLQEIDAMIKMMIGGTGTVIKVVEHLEVLEELIRVNGDR